MAGYLYEENNVYRVNCSAALWATDKMHEHYRSTNIELKDVDFVIEDEDRIYLVEYKNANIRNAVKPSDFDPLAEKTKSDVAKKYYDALHYLTLLNKNKAKEYIYVVESPKSDKIMRKKLRGYLKDKLPFKLQNLISNNVDLIEDVSVLSIDEWNNHRIYGRFPFEPVDT